VNPATGTAAASSNERFAGFRSTVVGRGHVFRERAALPAVHLVAGLEVVDALAGRLDHSGEVGAQLARLRLPEPDQWARDVGAPAEPVPVDRVQRRGADADEDGSLGRLRLLHLRHHEKRGSPSAETVSSARRSILPTVPASRR
jgi:hypothetical protein